MTNNKFDNSPIRSKDNFLIFGSPLIENDEINEVIASMKSGWLGTGAKVSRFEDDFRVYKGILYAQALNSCTAALHLSLLASGIGKGDEVITTAMTFCATVNAIIHCGATPVLVDCDRNTFNLDPIGIEEKINSKTKAIIPVHFAGRPCDMDAIMDIARRHHLIVIEDCAHAIEAEYKGRKTGTFGDVGCFSFYSTKNIVTGEGGMAITNNEEIANQIKVLGLHGMSKDAWKRFGDQGYKHYQVIQCGYKYNMMDLQAAIGLHQLKRVNQYWKRRQCIWNAYDQAFKELPIFLPLAPDPEIKHAYHLYTVLIDEQRTGITRDYFLNAMTSQNIGIGVHYVSIPEHPYYQKEFGWRPAEYPHAMAIGQQTVSLPISPKLTDADVQDVINAVKTILTFKYRKKDTLEK